LEEVAVVIAQLEKQLIPVKELPGKRWITPAPRIIVLEFIFGG